MSALLKNANGHIQILHGFGILFPVGVDAGSSDISFRLVPVYPDGLVVVGESFCRIFEKKVCRTAVEVCGRVFRLFFYVIVKI